MKEIRTRETDGREGDGVIDERESIRVGIARKGLPEANDQLANPWFEAH